MTVFSLVQLGLGSGRAHGSDVGPTGAPEPTEPARDEVQLLTLWFLCSCVVAALLRELWGCCLVRGLALSASLQRAPSPSPGACHCVRHELSLVCYSPCRLRPRVKPCSPDLYSPSITGCNISHQQAGFVLGDFLFVFKVTFICF